MSHRSRHWIAETPAHLPLSIKSPVVNLIERGLTTQLPKFPNWIKFSKKLRKFSFSLCFFGTSGSKTSELVRGEIPRIPELRSFASFWSSKRVSSGPARSVKPGSCTKSTAGITSSTVTKTISQQSSAFLSLSQRSMCH